MRIGDVYEVKIEKLNTRGQGIGKINGVIIFVNDSCPEDILKVKIIKINRSYMTGVITEIIEPSPNRTKPFCPMQKICGACQIQFINYDAQLKYKREMVEDTMRTIGNIESPVKNTVPSPKSKEYRNKIQYPVTQTKNSKRILAGYYKATSHEIVNIKYCPIQPQICDEIIDYIRNTANKDYNVTCYDEKRHKGLLKHIIIRHSAYNESCLVCLVANSETLSDELRQFCRSLYDNFPKIVGVCVNFNNRRTNVILGTTTVCVCGNDFLEEKICDKIFRISSDTFFQINIGTAQNIFYYIKEFIKNTYKNPIILDAYAGISAIGICLSDCAKEIVTIEENLNSVKMAEKTAILNHIENIEINGGDAEKFFENEKRKFDIVILDPPRKGCSGQSLDYALNLCNGHIIYVSCNPATLARDLKILKGKNCTIESIQPFDMFCHTYHVESVAIIKV